MHVCTFFALYSPSYPLSPPPFPPTGATPPPQAGPVLPSCSLILQKKKEKQKNMTNLFVWDKGSDSGSFLYNIYFNVTEIFLLQFFTSFIVFTFTYMCMHCLDHSPTPPLPGRTFSVLLFSDFVEKKT
jgi:hypothetical protein